MFDISHLILHLSSVFLLLRSAVMLWKAKTFINKYQKNIVLFGAVLSAALLLWQLGDQGWVLTKNPLWTAANSIGAYSISLLANNGFNKYLNSKK